MGTCVNFDLAIDERGSQYRVRVLRSPAGEGDGFVSKRIVKKALAERFADLVALIEGEASSSPLPSKAEIERFGEWLFATFFPDRVRELWWSSRHTEPDSVLRLRLRLDDVPELSRLPWEALCTPLGFIALKERTAIVRYPAVAVAPDLRRSCDPLRFLFVDTSPSGLSHLDVEAEWQALSSALTASSLSRSVHLDRLRSASRTDLFARLKEKVHAIHFAGHGFFDRRQERGVVVLSTTGREVDRLSALDWTTALAQDGALRLAVFNSCEGARHGDLSVFSGLAHALVRAGVPAVVAMQFPISDEAAVTFTRSFYAALALGEPVDLAVTTARREIDRLFPEEWASLVLFLRDEEGDVLDLRSCEKPNPAPSRLAGALSTYRALKRHPGRAALALSALALVSVLGYFRDTIAERWWRTERRASVPGPNREAPALPLDPSLDCSVPPELARLGLRFVPIPAARFSMGSSRGTPEERPVHDVEISRPFCFGKTEVTQAQWRAVTGSNPSSVKGDDLPVTNVSWNDAQEFLAKLNAIDPTGLYRLPTEAEWECSASLGVGRPYGFGDDPKLLRWYGNCYAPDDHDGFRRSAPVQEFEPNPWGIYGLHGNVSEWVLDRYGLYSGMPVVDPQGPEEGERRVRRGGSYRTNAGNCRATARFGSEPTLRQGSIGLRVVRAPVSKAPSSNVPD